MDCSVIIATYNRSHLLADTLRSLSAQQVPRTLQWEVVVVDNNSSDTTKETVRRFGETSSVPVRYEFEPRLGQSFARNSGIEVAKGAVILFTDDDILPERDWVSGMLSALTADRLDGVGGRVLPQWEADLPDWLSPRPDLLSWLALVEEDKPCRLEYPLSPHVESWAPAWPSDARSSRSSVDSRPVLVTEGVACMEKRRSNSSIGCSSTASGSATTRPWSSTIASVRAGCASHSSFVDISITRAGRLGTRGPRTRQGFSELSPGDTDMF